MLFTGHAGPGQLHDAVRAGPDGLLFKTETDQICEALVAMLGERSWRRHASIWSVPKVIATARVELSAGDICILRLAAEGRSVAQTARSWWHRALLSRCDTTYARSSAGRRPDAQSPSASIGFPHVGDGAR